MRTADALHICLRISISDALDGLTLSLLQTLVQKIGYLPRSYGAMISMDGLMFRGDHTYSIDGYRNLADQSQHQLG